MKKVMSIVLSILAVFYASLPSFAIEASVTNESPPTIIYKGQEYEMEHQGDDIYISEVPMDVVMNPVNPSDFRSRASMTYYTGKLRVVIDRLTLKANVQAYITSSSDPMKKVICRYTISYPGWKGSKSTTTTASSFLGLNPMNLNPVTFNLKPKLTSGPYAVYLDAFATITGVSCSGCATASATAYV